jgi:hypothetical protein
MVELVNDYDVERIGRNVCQVNLPQRLDGCEHVPALLGSLTVHEQFSEEPSRRAAL